MNTVQYCTVTRVQYKYEYHIEYNTVQYLFIIYCISIHMHTGIGRTGYDNDRIVIFHTSD